MSKCVLVITRKVETKESTISVFNGFSPDTDNSCLRGINGYILEEKGPSTTISGKDRRIPKGIYKLKWHNSPRFGKNLPLLYNDLVPASRYILIHSGNNASHTEGCLLVGSNMGENHIGNSRAKLDELLNYLGCFNLDSGKYTLEIKESF